MNLMNFLTAIRRYLAERRARHTSRNLRAFVSRYSRPVACEINPESKGAA